MYPNTIGLSTMHSEPHARAILLGGTVTGEVRFSQTDHGVLVSAEVFGLPHSGKPCQGGVFAFHIHDGQCSGGSPYAHSLGHYNPQDCLHPYHAGDLPPLFASVDGHAFLSLLTDRFLLRDILGKIVIIHGGVDDFTTQPAGNAGIKIACGEIQPLR